MRRVLVTCAVVSALWGCGGDDGDGGSKKKTDAGSGGVGASGGSGGKGGAGAGGAAGSASDGGTLIDGRWTQEQWDTIKTLSPLPAVPPDTTNEYADNANAAKLGQMLFFDKSISGALVVGDDGTNGGLGQVGETGKVSCASCHSSSVMDDNRSKPNNVSLGIDYGTRNAPALVNASFYAWINWGGRFDSQWSLPPAVAENPKTMKSTRLQIAHLMWNKYKTEYNAIFPVPLDPALDPAATDAARFPATGKPKANATDPDGPWELMTQADRDTVMLIWVNYGKAIAAYLRLLVSRNAAFDKYVSGDYSAVSASAKDGLAAFIGTGKCITCHSGPNFADDKFHALGAPQTGAHVPATDTGRYADVPPLLSSPLNTNGPYSADKNTGKLSGLAQDTSQIGKFRTKSLRGVASSALYMHAGQSATLADVVNFYSYGGGAVGDAGADGGITKEIAPIGFSAAESTGLVEFMKALDGEAVPAALLQDTSK